MFPSASRVTLRKTAPPLTLAAHGRLASAHRRSTRDAGEGRRDAHWRTWPRVHLLHIGLEPRQPVEQVCDLGPVERRGEHEVPHGRVISHDKFSTTHVL